MKPSNVVKFKPKHDRGVDLVMWMIDAPQIQCSIISRPKFEAKPAEQVKTAP